jgi:hypothetical protein
MMERISAVHDQFANQMIDIIDEEMVYHATQSNEMHDGMQALDQAWKQALEHSRSWAMMSRNFARDVQQQLPVMHEVLLHTPQIVDQVEQHEQGIHESIQAIQKQVRRVEKKAFNAAAPIVDQSFQQKRKEQQMKALMKAQPAIQHYVDILGQANLSTDSYVERERVTLLDQLDVVERQRLQLSLRLLAMYTKTSHKISKAISGLVHNAKDALDRMDADQLMSTFCRQTMKFEDETMIHFPYRIPIPAEYFAVRMPTFKQQHMRMPTRARSENQPEPRVYQSDRVKRVISEPPQPFFPSDTIQPYCSRSIPKPPPPPPLSRPHSTRRTHSNRC